MMTSQVSQRIRDYALSFMSELPVPPQSLDAEALLRPDGVTEFGLQWCVRGTVEHGVFASLSDRDDVIEFGLLARDGEVAVNILHATIVLDESDAQLNCMSENSTDFNFDSYVTPDNLNRLQEALVYFENNLLDTAA